MADPSPLSEHDVVELLQRAGEWPAGTTGAVVSVYVGAVLVEIVDASGRTCDLATRAPDQLARKRS